MVAVAVGVQLAAVAAAAVVAQPGKFAFKKQMSECVRYVRATYIIIQKETCHAAMSRWVAGGLADPRAEMFRREGSLTGPFPKPA